MSGAHPDSPPGLPTSDPFPAESAACKPLIVSARPSRNPGSNSTRTGLPDSPDSPDSLPDSPGLKQPLAPARRARAHRARGLYRHDALALARRSVSLARWLGCCLARRLGCCLGGWLGYWLGCCFVGCWLVGCAARRFVLLVGGNRGRQRDSVHSSSRTYCRKCCAVVIWRVQPTGGAWLFGRDRLAPACEHIVGVGVRLLLRTRLDRVGLTPLDDSVRGCGAARRRAPP
mmetsp:Transcript_40552/g.100155  ORF Transcript_40552/g.100155 Transcript_40552/m.100155 type:complete len:230 (+) Transcript_40552:166-855(+)